MVKTCKAAGVDVLADSLSFVLFSFPMFLLNFLAVMNHMTMWILFIDTGKLFIDKIVSGPREQQRDSVVLHTTNTASESLI
jgi:hypothetical protein